MKRLVWGIVLVAAALTWAVTVVNPLELYKEFRDRRILLNTYSKYYSDVVAYQTYGIKAKGIDRYFEQGHEFIPIRDVTMYKLLPPKSRYETFNLLDGLKERDMETANKYLFFACRIGMAEAGRYLYATSYLGAKRVHDFHHFTPVVDLELLTQKSPGTYEIDGTISKPLDWDPKALHGELLKKNGIFIPFGHNRFSTGDFVIGEHAYALEHTAKSVRMHPKSRLPEGRTLYLDNGARVAVLDDDGRLQVFDKNGEEFALHAMVTLDVATLSRRNYMLYPMPDIDGDQKEELIITQKEGFALLLSRASFAEQRTVSLGATPYLLGGIGEYTGDGTDDIWVLWRNEYDKDPGRAVLVDMGKVVASTTRRIGREEAVAFTLEGDTAYTDSSTFDEGIGSTVSLFAGDVDCDGKKDFSITSHFQQGWSGNMFIVPGSVVREKLGSSMSIRSKQVIKVLGELGSELAPPFSHYTNYDINKDGCSDVVVSADNDIEAGFVAGAIYILDGKQIAGEWGKR